MVTNTENTIGRIGLKEKQGFDFGLSGNEVPVIPRRQLEKSCFMLWQTVKSILESTARMSHCKKVGEKGHESRTAATVAVGFFYLTNTALQLYHCPSNLCQFLADTNIHTFYSILYFS